LPHYEPGLVHLHRPWAGWSKSKSRSKSASKSRSRSASMRVGEIEVEVVSGGRFRLDGGGMFGIIPRPLWARQFEPDDRGRIQLDTNCLLIRTGDEVLLVDTGNGGKLSSKERGIFDIADGDPLLRNLAATGVTPEAVTTVLLTHLHMDHVGGASRIAGDEIVPSFPNARFVVQRQEWEDALHNRSHMRTSYRLENLEPLRLSGRLHFLDGDAEVAPGVSVHVTGGHTRAHQCVFVRSRGETLWYPADICPTPAHLRGPYNMAYDMEPYQTMVAKEELLRRAADKGWLVAFDHEPERKVVRVERGEGSGFRVRGSVVVRSSEK
jgi:glyoxylase-like metal-dependent hydrolase (beta-lactamase superfamily II)